MVLDRSLSSAQVAFAFPRALGTAVERNRLRRRMRELLRARDLAPGLCLWGASPDAARSSFADLGHHVDVLLERGLARSARNEPRKVVE
jgi:ribonuclease P protein component